MYVGFVILGGIVWGWSGCLNSGGNKVGLESKLFYLTFWVIFYCGKDDD